MDRSEQVDDPVLIAAARHALHDEEVVAAYAVDGEGAEDAARAKSLIERCPTCRDLHADLVSIGATIRAAGSAEAVAAARPAPHDFRLTPLDAARLRPGNTLQRVAARLAAGAAMFGRPVGASLAALGLVGLLVGTVGLGQLGGSAAAPHGEGATRAGAGAATSAPAPGATFDAVGVQPAATQATDRSNVDSLASGAPKTTDGRQNGPLITTYSEPAAGSPASRLLFLLYLGSIVLLLVGGVLLFTGVRHARAWR